MIVLISETTKVNGGHIIGHVVSRHRTVLAAVKARKNLQPASGYIPTKIAQEASGYSLSIGEYVDESEVIDVDDDEIQDAYYML